MKNQENKPDLKSNVNQDSECSSEDYQNKLDEEFAEKRAAVLKKVPVEINFVVKNYNKELGILAPHPKYIIFENIHNAADKLNKELKDNFESFKRPMKNEISELIKNSDTNYKNYESFVRKLIKLYSAINGNPFLSIQLGSKNKNLLEKTVHASLSMVFFGNEFATKSEINKEIKAFSQGQKAFGYEKNIPYSLINPTPDKLLIQGKKSNNQDLIVAGASCAVAAGFTALAFAVLFASVPVITPVMLGAAVLTCTAFSAASAAFLVLSSIPSRKEISNSINDFKKIRLFQKPAQLDSKKPSISSEGFNFTSKP